MESDPTSGLAKIFRGNFRGNEVNIVLKYLSISINYSLGSTDPAPKEFSARFKKTRNAMCRAGFSVFIVHWFALRVMRSHHKRQPWGKFGLAGDVN